MDLKAFISFFCLISLTDAGKILFWCPFASKSVKITFIPLLEELANLGHDVTAVMPFKEKNAKYKIILSDPEQIVMKKLAEATESVMTGEDTNPINTMIKMSEFTYDLNDNALSNPDIQSLVKDPNTRFDIVIVQPIMSAETGYYLAHRFKAPIAIWNTAQSHLPFISTAVGQPYNPSYVQFPVLEAIGQMTFIERVKNTFASFMFEHIFRNIVMVRNANLLLDKHFPGEIRPDLLELEKTVSVAFSFGHPLILDGWAPMVPNYIQLGMMNCRPGKAFPANDTIGDFLDQSKNGVIFLSFGSIIKPSAMPKEHKEMFLNNFERFPQYDFIWKWDEELPNKPKNVLVSDWLPQQDILAHPNLKVFMTHAGQSSMQELLCHQKPAVPIPVQGDQPLNAKELVRMGVGLSVPYSSLTENDLFQALDTVIHDTKYAEKAKEIGSILKDQITRPLDRAVWWVEHVMRHPTMYAGKSPVHKLYWHQYFLLDVLAVYAVILYIISKVVKFLFTLCFSNLRKSKLE